MQHQAWLYQIQIFKSLPPLHGTSICCSAKKIWLSSMVFFLKLCVCTTSSRCCLYDNVIFRFFIIVCCCNILLHINRGRFGHGCGLKASAPQLFSETCWLTSYTGWTVSPWGQMFFVVDQLKKENLPPITTERMAVWSWRQFIFDSRSQKDGGQSLLHTPLLRFESDTASNFAMALLGSVMASPSCYSSDS